jgi:hypothetical protein
VARLAQAGQVGELVIAALAKWGDVVDFERAVGIMAVLAGVMVTHKRDLAYELPFRATGCSTTRLAAKAVLRVLRGEYVVAVDVSTLYLAWPGLRLFSSPKEQPTWVCAVEALMGPA